MNVKRDSISELREKLANAVKELKITKGAAQNLKRLMTRIVKEDGNQKPIRRRDASKPDGLEIFGGSESAESNKKNFKSFGHYAVADEDKELENASLHKSSRQKLEDEGDLKDLVGP